MQRLCFYRRVSASVHAGIPHPPQGADTSPKQTPPEQTAPQEQTPPLQQTSPQSSHPQEQTPPPPGADTPRGDTPRSRHPPGSRHPPPPRGSHCCGQYASYWNAFLLHRIFKKMTRIDSSRMHTVCCSGRLRGGGVCLGCVSAGGVYLGVCVHLPSTWTEFLTHACENITFLQLHLRTVINTGPNPILQAS